MKTMLHFGTLGIDLLKHFEGYRDTAYDDGTGVWTIGYGSTLVNGHHIHPGMTCTVDEATEWMMSEVRKTEPMIRSVESAGGYDPDGRPFTQYEFDALVCFTYNIGTTGFLSSSLCRKIRSSPYGIRDIAETNFTDWNKARINGILTPLPGLTRRRKAEYHLFTTGTLQFQF